MNRSTFNFDTAALTLVCLGLLAVYAVTREGELLLAISGAVGAIGGIAQGNHRTLKETNVSADVAVTKE